MQILISELTRLARPALEKHFLALGVRDRRLRFGVALSDVAIAAYVARMDFDRDAVFGVFDDHLDLLGVAHLGHERGHVVAGARTDAELGISVLEGHRGGGIGGALLARAHMHARNWGARVLYMHCLAENGAMMRLARKQGMAVVAEAGEANASLRLAPADASSYMGAVFAQRVALFDYALKQGRSWLAPGR